MSSETHEQSKTTEAQPHTVSKKLGNNNALTHGGTSQKLILPGENEADFQALLAGIRDEYQPATQQHQLFVEQLAIAHWFLCRRQRACNAIEEYIYGLVDDSPEWMNTDHLNRLALADRYRTAAERALKRAFNNAESIRKERCGERDYHERHARWQAEQELRERRVRLAEQNSAVQNTRKQSKGTASLCAEPPAVAEQFVSQKALFVRPGEPSATIRTPDEINEDHAISPSDLDTGALRKSWGPRG